ncbi:heterogeneous nuclear ribonucleoprotein 1 [Physcomitrium patens]|uniref:heterogeneous nuclear ribonucleoprotein 1 n=1 Tax=Physcomitrium patens TaxID=3218 RepID=UPI003CCE38A3
MDSDQGKLFIGGISWETTEEKLRDYFKSYGEVAETVIMKDRATGRARGFGFVIFADPSVADRVAGEKHTIDGRTVEAKKAVPRDEQQSIPRSNSVGGQGPATSHTRTKKIFVGGLASTVTEDDFKKYFEQFGTITDVVVMYDHNTQRPRGFGFITFDSEDAVENVIQKSFHELNDKMVEVKKAIPKELSAGSGRAGGGFGGGGRGGGNYGSGYSQGGYGGGSPGGGSGYGGRGDSRMDVDGGSEGAGGGEGVLRWWRVVACRPSVKVKAAGFWLHDHGPEMWSHRRRGADRVVGWEWSDLPVGVV